MLDGRMIARTDGVSVASHASFAGDVRRRVTMFEPMLPRPACVERYVAMTSAAASGLIADKPTVAVDATGLESRHTSRYFARQSGAEHATWTKLTIACDTASHFLAGATVTTGPSNDSPQFPPVMAQASLVVTWDRVLADAAFDAEEHHRYPREDLGVRSTVIPLNRRGRGREWPKTTYRRQMVKRFRKKPKGCRHRRVYGQRWQAESAFSRHKRRLGSALAGKSDGSRERECRLRVLTHNLMLLAATGYCCSSLNRASQNVPAPCISVAPT